MAAVEVLCFLFVVGLVSFEEVSGFWFFSCWPYVRFFAGLAVSFLARKKHVLVRCCVFCPVRFGVLFSQCLGFHVLKKLSSCLISPHGDCCFLNNCITWLLE